MALELILDKSEYSSRISVISGLLGEREFFSPWKYAAEINRMKIIFKNSFLWTFILKNIEGYEINHYDISLKNPFLT